MRYNRYKLLKGIIPPMITPLIEREKLDVEGLEKLVEHIVAGGVHGLFILGTTGEAPALSYNLRYELVKRTSKLLKQRLPLLVGITDTSYTETIKLAQYSYEQGAYAVVLAPPYYFKSAQAELLEYLDHLAGELPLPLFLYNMPGTTKVHIEPDTVVKAAENEKILGIKDSSMNMIYFHKLRHLFRNVEDFTLLVGPEELLAECVLLGGHGGVCGGANIFPSLYVNLYDAALKGDTKKVLELHQKVIRISMTIYSTGKYSSSVLKGIKCSLGLMGICNDFISEPFHRFRKAERSKIQDHLNDIAKEM